MDRFEKFEKKVNELKNNMDKRTYFLIVYAIVGAIAIFGMQMTNMYKREKQKVQDAYNKSMYELINYVQNVDILISKARITGALVESNKTLADIWRQSNLAKDNLASLPLNQNSMKNTSKFLAQTSDYSYSLMVQTIGGKEITDEQYKILGDLNDNSKKISDTLNKIYGNLNNGKLKWDEVEEQGDKDLSKIKGNEVLSNIGKISKDFTEYEGLIYDGAYSNHITEATPIMIENTEEVTEDTAKQNAKKILEGANANKEIEYIKSSAESKGKIDIYSFTAKYKNREDEINIDISKKGGLLVLMVSDRNVGKKKISVEEAKQKGLEFLEKIRIKDMKATYYLEVDNMLTVNYAAVQNNVVLYPDLIKVKIAMDTGEICSVETSGYIFNHKEREDTSATISIEQARKTLSPGIEIMSEDMAIIPTEANKEILTYEFKGKINGKEFLIYVNAKTGAEEKVLIIINTPGGTLTM